MFSQSADQPATDESPAPVGMRELPPQPAKPVMPAYGMSSTGEPDVQEAGPGPDDSVVAVDDHVEGTFTSRGTVVVKGSLKGRIEAIRVRIEDGASVEADVIVDEAIVAGEFNGNLTCRERLEAQASGRINGKVETFKLMLHEGASVEGEMHMLTGAPRDAKETIRGSASPRGGEIGSPPEQAKAEPTAPLGRAATTKPAPTATPASSAQTAAPAPTPATESEARPKDAAAATRQSIAETLRAETLRVAPRTTTTVSSYSGGPTSPGNGAKTRSGSTPTGI